MRKPLILLFAILSCAVFSPAQVISPATSPNESQRALQKQGYGMFMHFGPNTFTDAEWSDGTIPVSKYNPTKLDPDQWVRVARDAGFRYVLLITKHHDGFCLWDSKYTDYDVASSPVKTDVVKAVSDACRKYKIGFAVYYSLWDRHEPSYRLDDKSKYIDYMCNQLTELFTNYGDICQLWLDGGWDREVADWHLERVYNHVKSMQPKCAIGVNHTIALKPGTRQLAHPDVMTVDNKYTFQYFPGDFRLGDPDLPVENDPKLFTHDSKTYYMPWESTVCISQRWFYNTKDTKFKSVDELEKLYRRATANDNILILNCPPGRDGRLRQADIDLLLRLRERIDSKN